MMIPTDSKPSVLSTPATRDSDTADEREHRIAESLRRALPEHALPGVTVLAFYQAAMKEAIVGGDSCDAFPLTGGRVALAIADASGKGLAASKRMAEVRFALRAFLHEHADWEGQSSRVLGTSRATYSTTTPASSSGGEKRDRRQGD